MTSEREPTRLRNQLEGATKGALTAYASQGPNREQLARMGDRLMVDISRGVAPRSASTRSGNATWWLGSAGLLGVLLASFMMLRPTAVETSRVVKLAAPPPVAVDPPPVPAAPREAPSARPSVPARASGIRAAGPKRPAALEQTGQLELPSDPPAELALLRPARQLLVVRPARALELTEEHKQRFPNGLFSEERTVLRIEALARLGRRHEAQTEARAFRKRYPSSGYLVRVNELLPPQ